MVEDGTQPELKEFLLNEKPLRALSVLYRHEAKFSDAHLHVSVISDRINSTYSYAVIVTGQLEEHGIIKSRKEGRKKVIELTDHGECLAQTAVKLIDTIADHENLDESEMPTK